MKIAFISDIHGNYEALKSVLSEMDKLDISRVYCAGDIVGYYSQVNECCRELRARRIESILGNHDWYLAGGGFCPRSKSANECIAYQRGVIEKDNLAWLRSLPVHMQIGSIKMVHGGWGDPLDEYVNPTRDYFENIEGQVFVSGHTHIQSLQKYDEKIYCNPGSVGQPRDGDPRAAYAIYDGVKFELRRVEYDMQKVFELMDVAGFNDYYYGSLRTGARRLKKLTD